MLSLLHRAGGRVKRTLAAFATDTGASTAIEFAFTVPIFITLSIGILWVGITYLAREHLETIAENVAYQLEVQNPALTGGLTQAQFQQYICNNLSGIFDCNKVLVDYELASSTYNPYPNLTFSNGVPQYTGNYTSPTAGTGGTWTLTVMYLWPTIQLPFGLSFGDQADGSLLLMSVQVFTVDT